MKETRTTEKTRHREVKVAKVVVAVGLGKARQKDAHFEDKVLPDLVRELAAITGQLPRVTKAKKSIAGFKVRQGESVGLQVTLRGARMRDFLAKVLRIALPRVRDFRGIRQTSIDGEGNLSIGFRDQMVFPEVNPETSKVNFGLQVTIVPNRNPGSGAVDFYRGEGVPWGTVESAPSRGKKRQGSS